MTVTLKIISTYQQNSYLTFTSSKLIQETVEQKVKYVKLKRKTPIHVNWPCSGVFLLILDIFLNVF